MQIRIQIWSLLLVKVVRICGHWFTAPWLYFELLCFNCERPHHSNKGPQLLNVDFHFYFLWVFFARGSAPQDFRHATDSRVISSVEDSVAGPHHFIAVPDPFTLMRILIRLFTLIRIWILFLLKAMLIRDHRFTAPWHYFEPLCLNCECPWPSNKGPQLFNVDFNFVLLNPDPKTQHWQTTLTRNFSPERT